MVDSKREYARAIAKNIQPSLKPLFERLEKDPTPSDWGAFAGYLRLAYHSFNVLDKDTRIKLVQYAERFVKVMNEKLKETPFEVRTFEGKTILYNPETREAFEIGFTEIWSILASRNVSEVVERIVEKNKGIYYNIKYYPIDNGGFRV